MNSYLRVFVGTKDYITAPLAYFCGGINFEFDGADSKVGVDDKVVIAQFGKQKPFGARFPKNYYFDINATENFGAEWVINIPSHTVVSPVDVKLYLEGIRRMDVR